MGQSDGSEMAASTNRRDLLKLSGAAAVGAAGFWAAASAAMASEADAATTVAHIPTKVVMSWAGRQYSKIIAMSQASELTSSSGGSAGGGGATSRITITREYSNDTTFYDWFTAAAEGTSKAQPVVVTVLGKRHSQISQLTMSDAQAVGWSGPGFVAKGTAPATESLTLAAETWTYL